MLPVKAPNYFLLNSLVLKNKAFVFVVFSLISSSYAATIDLQKDFPVNNNSHLYETLSEAQVAKLKPLSRLKYYELKKNREGCRSLAPQLLQKEKLIQGWVALSWMHCLGEQISDNDLNTIAEQAQIFDNSSCKQTLWTQWLDAKMNTLQEASKNKAKISEKSMLVVLNFYDKLNRDEKVLINNLLGQFYLQKKDDVKALFYFQVSLGLKEDAAIAAKVNQLSKNDKPSIAENTKDEKANQNSELTIEQKINQLIKQDDLVLAIRDCVEYLNQNPGAKLAKKLKDKPLEIYNTLYDKYKKADPKMLESALLQMSALDPQRQVEWIMSLHRRADYAAALSLVDKIYEQVKHSSSATTLAWIGGRSAHFIGRYETALKYYNELIQHHAGSDEASEALFRSALIKYRQKEYASAVVLFEKVLFEKKDRYELSARYWLVRCFQKDNNVRLQSAIDELTKKFPLSYYGIRVRAEQKNNRVLWPEVSGDIKQPSRAAQLYLEGEQLKSWSRFQSLLKNGWLTEAQLEWQELPKPSDASTLLLTADLAAKAGLQNLALKLVNEATDLVPDWRQQQFLALSFPQSFKEIYISEGSRRDVNARLLMSLTRQESAFNVRALSTSNAMGLMQLIPPTAKEVGQKLGLKKLEIPEDLYRPDVNISMGSFYISEMLKKFNDSVPFALAAYNAGPDRLNLWIQARPEIQQQMQNPTSLADDEIWIDELPWNETSFYVKAILRNTLIYRLQESGEFELSPVLWSDLVNKKAVVQ